MPTVSEKEVSRSLSKDGAPAAVPTREPSSSGAVKDRPVVISLDDVTLAYPIFGINARSLRKTLFTRRTGGKIDDTAIPTVTALSHLSLEIRDGDRVGLIGHNGAGKTSMLRMLAGVYEPTMGKLSINGSVSSLLNPSLGMDLEDNAYDNIRTMGLFLGMTPSEIDRKMDGIAEFTELGDYLNLPVKTYSSGMQLRLAFAIATSIDPQILLLDEGFGFGDLRFADKAQKRVEELIERTRVLIIATHAEALVRQMCTKALLLEEGRGVMFTDVESVIAEYHRRNEALG